MTASSRLFVSDTNINLTVLGFDIAFRAGADMERAQESARLVEERFALLKSRSQGGQGREFRRGGRGGAARTRSSHFPWSPRDLRLGANLTSICKRASVSAARVQARPGREA